VDWKSEASVRRWLVDVRTAFDDADAVAVDMLRPVRERELGHVQHRNLYGDARKALIELLEYAAQEGGDAAG